MVRPRSLLVKWRLFDQLGFYLFNGYNLILRKNISAPSD